MKSNIKLSLFLYDRSLVFSCETFLENSKKFNFRNFERICYSKVFWYFYFEIPSNFPIHFKPTRHVFLGKHQITQNISGKFSTEYSRLIRKHNWDHLNIDPHSLQNLKFT